MGKCKSRWSGRGARGVTKQLGAGNLSGFNGVQRDEMLKAWDKATRVAQNQEDRAAQTEAVMTDDLKHLPCRALVDRAIASLSEIERRMGRGSEVTAMIRRLLEFGRQFDDIPCSL